MAKTKYGHLVKTMPVNEGPGGANAQELIWMFGKDLENFSLNFALGRYEETSVWHPWAGPHVHPTYDECLIFFGHDPKSLGYLGAEIEIALGKEQEKHMFKVPTVVTVPKGLPHLPLVVKNISPSPPTLLYLFPPTALKERGKRKSFREAQPLLYNYFPLSFEGEGDTGGEVDNIMKTVETIADLKSSRAKLAEPVGFVPTMGYLHEGHLALVRQARAENPSVVVSIFVNPTQFGPHEDFKRYPRHPQRDLALLEKEGVDLVFMPSVDEIYPPEFNSWVEVGKVAEKLEGASRPGHFRGVATVVARLFNLVQPNKTYFGQKDAQQLIVIRKMVADLDMNLEVVAVPTVREADGLAMSSRNTYLNPEERKQAAVLYQALTLAQKLYAEGEKDAKTIRQKMTDLIQKQPLADIDYISIADAETLDELDEVRPPALVSLAVKIGRTRLIDNVVVG